MIVRRTFTVILCALFIGCLQHFDTFEPTGALPDAAPPDATIAQEAAAPAQDAAPSDATFADVIKVDSGSCPSAPQNCLTDRTNCRGGCDTTASTCDTQCGADNTCKQNCRNALDTCRNNCSATCRTCAGACIGGC